MQLTNQNIFTTEQAACNYGVLATTIQEHKRNHSDELIDGIHYFKTCEQTRGGRQELIKWTLKGIVVLGFFIRSPQAKSFRIWASNQLEKELLRQAEEFKEAKERNLRLIDENSALNLELTSKSKRHQREINGYKSQIAQHNAVIVRLKNELAEFKPTTPRPETLRALLEHARKDRDFYRQKSIKIEKEKRDKEMATFRALQQIKSQMEPIFTAIGAVEAYVINDDRYFMENNEILKGY